MMPLNPSPKAAAMTNRPTSSCVSRKHAMATAWKAEPTITVRSPPMRAARAARPADAGGQRAPHLARDEGGRQHHRQHDGAVGRADADAAAEGDEMRRGYRHGNAAQEAGEADQRLGEGR